MDGLCFNDPTINQRRLAGREVFEGREVV